MKQTLHKIAQTCTIFKQSVLSLAAKTWPWISFRATMQQLVTDEGDSINSWLETEAALACMKSVKLGIKNLTNIPRDKTQK